MKINIAGVNVDNVSNAETIYKINSFVQEGGFHYVVTPYSEIIVFAQDNPKYLQVLNQANLSLPDGIGVLWAAKYLSLPGNWLSSLWQIVYTGAAIIFKKHYIQTVIRQQVTGSRLVYDLAKLAEEKNYSLALVGGIDNVAAQAAYNLKKQFPNLRINLAISGRAFDERTMNEINHSNSDILLIAYSPPKQETWLYENRDRLQVKVAIGLGGTFDYIARKHASAPQIWHQMGLEWLWRLITQPSRFKRIWNAVPVFIWKIYKYKIHDKTGNR